MFALVPGQLCHADCHTAPRFSIPAPLHSHSPFHFLQHIWWDWLCSCGVFPEKSQARPGGLTKEDLKLFADCKLKQNNLRTQILDFIEAS